MNFPQLNKLQYLVGKAMRENPLFRTHKGREALVQHIKEIKPDASMESITRAQRKLWEIAITALEQGNTDYAFNILPNTQKEFEVWMAIRKVQSEKYRRYYSDWKTQTQYIQYPNFYTCRLCGKRVKGNPQITNYICISCRNEESQ